MTRLEFLQEIEDMVNHNLLCYSKDYLMAEPKEEYQKEWQCEQEKRKIVNQMIKEEKQKSKERER